VVGLTVFNKLSIRNTAFHLTCFLIVLVSSIDIYWLSKNRDLIHEYELNPIGQYLLRLDNGDVSLFILCKTLGTYIVIASLYILFHYRKRYAIVSISILAIIQIILLFYLSVGPWHYDWIF